MTHSDIEHAALPEGWREVTAEEARLGWVRGAVVELWNTRQARRYAAVVQRWTEDAVWVRVCNVAALPHNWQHVALDVWDADLDDGAPYPPRARSGAWVAVTRAIPLSVEDSNG